MANWRSLDEYIIPGGGGVGAIPRTFRWDFSAGRLLGTLVTRPPMSRPSYKLDLGTRLASLNPYPISDQNMRFSIPDFRPNPKINVLFQTS